MDFTYYIVVVTVAALIYSFAAREIQFRFGNRKEMEEFQKKSKVITDEINDASKRKDNAKLDELMKKQSELMKSMGGMMVGQLKTMAPVILMFLAFTWLISNFDPTLKDDITIQLLDDGIGCDATASDGMFSACYTPTVENYGAWALNVKAMNNNNLIGENSTYFIYNSNDESAHIKAPTGEQVAITLSPQKLGKNQELKIIASNPKAHSMTAFLDNGTIFYVDLPFTIPLINVQRIYEAYWWFLFVTIISGIGMSFILGQVKKKQDPQSQMTSQQSQLTDGTKQVK